MMNDRSIFRFDTIIIEVKLISAFVVYHSSNANDPQYHISWPEPRYINCNLSNNKQQAVHGNPILTHFIEPKRECLLKESVFSSPTIPHFISNARHASIRSLYITIHEKAWIVRLFIGKWITFSQFVDIQLRMRVSGAADMSLVIISFNCSISMLSHRIESLLVLSVPLSFSAYRSTTRIADRITMRGIKEASLHWTSNSRHATMEQNEKTMKRMSEEKLTFCFHILILFVRARGQNKNKKRSASCHFCGGMHYNLTLFFLVYALGSAVHSQSGNDWTVRHFD